MIPKLKMKQTNTKNDIFYTPIFCWNVKKVVLIAVPTPIEYARSLKT